MDPTNTVKQRGVCVCVFVQVIWIIGCFSVTAEEEEKFGSEWKGQLSHKAPELETLKAAYSTPCVFFDIVWDSIKRKEGICCLH